MTQDLSPGMLVRHPLRPDWGIGQVQSAIGHRVTVNFEHAGKVLSHGTDAKPRAPPVSSQSEGPCGRSPPRSDDIC